MDLNNKKKIKPWRRILALIFTVLSVMLVYLLIWSKNMFGDIPFAQVLFHLMVPLEGTDASIIESYFDGVLPWIGVALVYVFIFFLPDLIGGNGKKSSGPKEKKNIFIKIIDAMCAGIEFFRRFVTRYYLSVSSVALIIVIIVDIFGFRIDEWLVDRFDASTIYEDYYVYPENAKITFPEDSEKKNLIFIMSESLEASFADVENGGCMDFNYIPYLTQLAKENTHFSRANNLAGATEVEGTGWTIAAMVAQMAGVPLNVPIGQNGYGSYAEFLPGITSMGELLEKEGYVNQVVLGSKSEFSGMDTFFKQHGNYDVFDFYRAKKEKYIKKHNGFWGVDDRIIFQVAKDYIEKLESTDKPFNLVINTIDLHTPSGYRCADCPDSHDSKYKNIMACQDRMIYEFVEWCKTQDFYDNTVIVISGDHLSMAPVMKNEYTPRGYERSTYHVIINSDLEVANNTYRQFTTMDMYPTILASLGCKIEGERLGLGTNLYSGKKTVMEELGKEVFKEEISKTSKLYNEELVGTK